MTTAAAPIPTLTPPRAKPFETAADWWHSLGDVPLERVIFNPLPGTATEQDLLLYVERDKRLCELVDGTLVEKPVGTHEAYIASLVVTHLNVFVLAHDLGVVLGPDGMARMFNGRVRLPDVAFVSRERVATLPDPMPAILNFGPDLVGEVLSVSNTPREIDQKLRECFASGTRLAWVIDPATKSVAVYTDAHAASAVLTAADVLDGGNVVPGFSIRLSDIFRPTIRNR